VARILTKWAAGRSNIAKPLGKFCSAHVASLGASLVQSSTAYFSSRSASALSGALRIARILCATGLRWSRRVT